MHAHQRSHLLSAISNSLFKYDHKGACRYVIFFLGVEVEWHSLLLILFQRMGLTL